MSHNCRLYLLVLFQYYHLWCWVQKWVILFHRFKLKQLTHNAFLLQTAHPQSLHTVHREFRINSTHSDPFFWTSSNWLYLFAKLCTVQMTSLTVKRTTATTNWNWNGRIYRLSQFERVCSDLQLCFNFKMRPLNPLVLYSAFPALVLLLTLVFISAGSMAEKREHSLLFARHCELL